MVSKQEQCFWNKKFFLLRKAFLILRKSVLFWDMLLFQIQYFLQKGQENFSQWVYFSYFEKNILIFSCFKSIFLKQIKFFSISSEGFAVHSKYLKTYWEIFSWYEKHILKWKKIFGKSSENKTIYLVKKNFVALSVRNFIYVI